MRKFYTLLIGSLFIISFSGCSDDEAESAIDVTDAKLVANIEGGEKEMTIFEENSDIRFYIKLTNSSDIEVEAGSYFDYCAIFNIKEYLLVYKWTKKDGDEKESWIPLGKAYVPPVNCPAINIPLTIPPNGETGVAGAYWSQNPNNLPLGKGKYYTALPYTLEIGGKSKNIDLKLEFEVR